MWSSVRGVLPNVEPGTDGLSIKGRRSHAFVSWAPTEIHPVHPSPSSPLAECQKKGTVRACLYRKSDSAIMVMKSSEDGRRYDAAHVLDGAMDRSVLVERAMRPQLVIVCGILR